jgi:hypothetical protein
MLFIPMIQAVAMQREENHHRRPAESSEPMTRHIRIDKGQLIVWKLKPHPFVVKVVIIISARIWS